jgi:hypothetical protein
MSCGLRWFCLKPLGLVKLLLPRSPLYGPRDPRPRSENPLPLDPSSRPLLLKEPFPPPLGPPLYGDEWSEWARLGVVSDSFRGGGGGGGGKVKGWAMFGIEYYGPLQTTARPHSCCYITDTSPGISSDAASRFLAHKYLKGRSRSEVGRSCSSPILQLFSSKPVPCLSRMGN